MRQSEVVAAFLRTALNFVRTSHPGAVSGDVCVVVTFLPCSCPISSARKFLKEKLDHREGQDPSHLHLESGHAGIGSSSTAVAGLRIAASYHTGNYGSHLAMLAATEAVNNVLVAFFRLFRMHRSSINGTRMPSLYSRAL